MPLTIKNLSSIPPSLGMGKNSNAVSSVGKLVEPASTSISHPGGDPLQGTTSVTHSGGLPVSGLTSIGRVNQTNSGATTSINRTASANDENQSLSQEEMDERRYRYVQQLAKAKKARQVQEPDAYDLNLKTGGGFRTRGFRSVRRKLSRLYKQAPLTYKNLSVSDRQYFADLVKEHSSKVRAGVGLVKAVRRKMGYQLEKDRKARVISKYDKADFKKIVDEMKPKKYD